MAAAASYIVRSPQWIFTYLGLDITADVSQMVLAIRYVDRLDGASGELEVDLEDSTKQWQGSWYPAPGDVVSLQIGYNGEALLDCGQFQIDELELDGPPDVMRLRCLAAYITPAMRTANTVAYEKVGILEIATQIADTGANVKLKSLFVEKLPKSGREPQEVLDYLQLGYKAIVAAV